MSSRDHHQPCACGAELADECPRCARTNPLGSMRIRADDEAADRRLTAAALIGGMRERTFFGEAQVAQRVAAEMIRQRATPAPVVAPSAEGSE